MFWRKTILVTIFSVSLLASAWVMSPIWAGMEEGVFHGFTGHIYQQINRDKREFVDAESCTQWFYQQLRKPPRQSPVQRTSVVPLAPRRQGDDETERCLSEYPNGIDGARQAFGETQSALLLSVNVYQFALVGDRDDDREYSSQELRDVLESFGVAFSQRRTREDYVTSLNRKFDSLHQSGEYSVLHDGIKTLYEKGYRLSSADQEALNRVLG